MVQQTHSVSFNILYILLSFLIMLIRLWFIIVACLIELANNQNNPICKAKRYQCAKEDLGPGVCVKVADEQEKYYYVTECSGEKSYCPFEKAKYGVPALCELPAAAPAQAKVPFDKCAKDEECKSLSCVDGVCKGKLQEENCKVHEDCDPGLFCDSLTKLCIPQREFDQECSADLECVNNCVCNNNKCAFYYTFTVGADANNKAACESGYIEDGKCVAGLRTKSPGQPCSSDQDCTFIDGAGLVKSFGECTCGFNAGMTWAHLGSYSYCTLESGDAEFKAMIRALRFLNARNFGCHTTRRFGPCSNLYEDEYNDYHFKLNKLKMSPLIIGNERCIAKVYTWDYWKYFLNSNLAALRIGLFLVFSLYVI